MAKKLDWSKWKTKPLQQMNSDYWCNPSEGFDKKWHQKAKKAKEKREADARKRAVELIRSKK